MKLLISLLILLLAFQNCSPLHFSTDDVGTLLSGVRNQDGQVFDGKLRILHHLVDGYTCEGHLVPESILIHDTDGVWTWIQNTPEKCAASQHAVEGALINYDESTKTAIYDGKTYVPPRPYNVSTSEDPNLGDVNLKDGVCADINGQCSLRAAVEQSAPTSLTEAVIVNVPAGTFTLTDAVALALEPDANLVQIRGAGMANTILDGASAKPHFEILTLSASKVSIENMTLQNGHDPFAINAASIQINPNQSFEANATAPTASVSISDCIFQGNDNGAGVIYVSPGAGSLQIHRTQFLNNSTVAVIQADHSNGLLVEDSNFASNGSSRGITLIKNTASVLIRNSSFSANYEALRFTDCSDCSFENISVYRNVANGIYLSTTDYQASYDVHIRQATLYDNVTLPFNGQINSDLSFGFKDARNTVIMTNSIVGMKVGSQFPACMSFTGYFQNLTATNSLFTDASCKQTGTGNLVGDPMLAAAADNGGLTPTLLPLAGSPAINAGSDAVCTAKDQRGVARPISRCDIGAVEQ